MGFQLQMGKFYHDLLVVQQSTGGNHQLNMVTGHLGEEEEEHDLLIVQQSNAGSHQLSTVAAHRTPANPQGRGARGGGGCGGWGGI